MGGGQGPLEDMELSFWKGKKVFLTGHTGFKGAWLSLWLEKLGARVTGYSLKPDSSPNLYDLLKSSLSVHSVIGDVRDAKKLHGVMVDFSPDIVIHLAAQSLVRRSYDHPSETFSTNVLGTTHVLESVRTLPSTKATLIVTTDKCYAEDPTHKAYSENDRLGGSDPYSASKACAEIVAESYRASFFPLASARAGNVIGGGDWCEDRLIPDCVRAFRSGKSAVIRHPHAVRPWQHVLELLAGYLMLCEKLYKRPQKFSSAWNFGPEKSEFKKVSEVVRSFSNYWGDGARWKAQRSVSKKHEAPILRLDSTAVRKALGWKTRLPLEKALRQTADWYLAHGKGRDMVSVSLKDIEDYESILP